MCKNVYHTPNDPYVSVCPRMGTKGKMTNAQAFKISQTMLAKRKGTT
jgi:hypothetical protein